MTDTNLLNEKIFDSGLKKGWLAEKIGLSTYGFSLKINNSNQFNAREIQKLCTLLNIKSLREKERIFFADEVGEMATKCPPNKTKRKKSLETEC